MERKIDPKDYDYIWSVGNVSYLYVSLWLGRNYRRYDFIVTSDNEYFSLFLSHKDRKKIDKKGLDLYNNSFDAYKKSIQLQLAESNKFFPWLKKINFESLSNQELASLFYLSIKHFQDIWRPYFWTEYFCLDTVDKIIVSRDKKYDYARLQKNVRIMAKLKYQLRSLINQTFYPQGFMDQYSLEFAERFPELKWPIKNYSYQEIIQLLRGKKVKIPDRTYYVKGKFSLWREICGGKAKIISRKLNDFDTNIQSIKGKTGNGGFWRGRVKIIHFDYQTDFAREINQMKKGEVLVSGSTGPEMILACRKAGAIVTDEGGITSHAALVSRELKIPSVIGTKIASRVLKDGDLVEVDANKGLVRLI